MSNINVYSPEDVVVNWAGAFEITGFAEGTMVEASRNSPRTQTVVGAKGDVGITRSADRTGSLTLTLLQNSPSNQMLSAIINAEDLSNSLLIRGDMTIKDPSGGTLCYANRCHIQEPASVTLGDGQNAKVWVFFVEDLRYADVPAGVYNKLTGVTDAVASMKTITEQLNTVGA